MFFTKRKLRFPSSIMDEMHEIGQVNLKRFWKLRNKTSANRDSKANLPGNIKPSDWVSHFKSIFQSERNVEI